MSRVSNELIMPPNVHSVQTAGYETARAQIPKRWPERWAGNRKFINRVTFQCALEGCAKPLFVVPSRPVPPTFQPVNPTQIKRLKLTGVASKRWTSVYRPNSTSCVRWSMFSNENDPLPC
jgi:hypothetical protein